MGGIANNKCKCLDRSNTMDVLRCQAAIVIEKSENGQAFTDPLAVISSFIGKAN